MAVTQIFNHSDGWLVMYLEPLGEDRWLRPGQTFEVRSDYDGPNCPFTIEFLVDHGDHSYGIESVSVWVNEGNCYAEVTDETGAATECGHQRPADVHERWAKALPHLRAEGGGQAGGDVDHQVGGVAVDAVDVAREI